MSAATIEVRKDATDPNSDLPYAERLGNCYELAARYSISNDSVLVHGTIQGVRVLGSNAPIIGHAWVINDDGSVFEPTAGLRWPAEWLFQRFHNSVEIVRYTPAQAACAMLRSGHFGTWHDEEPSC